MSCCTVAIPSSPPGLLQSRLRLAGVRVRLVARAAGSPLRRFGLLRAQIREEASPTPHKSGSAPAGLVLKRRRPAPRMVLVESAEAIAAAAAAVAIFESYQRNEVEEEGEMEMEDRQLLHLTGKHADALFTCRQMYTLPPLALSVVQEP